MQGISKATLGLKLGQLLSDATKAVDSKLYPPKARQGQKRKRPSQDEARAAANDHADDHAELDSILDNSMAALGSEDDQDVCIIIAEHIHPAIAHLDDVSTPIHFYMLVPDLCSHVHSKMLYKQVVH